MSNLWPEAHQRIFFNTKRPAQIKSDHRGLLAVQVFKTGERKSQRLV
jgi:hypothetical protein